MAQQVKDVGQAKFVDTPLPETFADLVSAVYYDGAVVRLDFWVKRYQFGPPGTGQSDVTTTHHPACRLVLPESVFRDLLRVATDVEAGMKQRKQG